MAECGLLAIIAAMPFVVRGATAIADFSNTKQTIRGYGAATVTWQGTIPDSYFDVGYGSTSGNLSGSCGLTIARIRIPPSTNSSDWTSEVANGAAAKSRGAAIMATPWSPPASMKDNNSIVQGHLLTSAYDDYANHLNNFVNYCRNNGSPLYAVSVQNEPDLVGTSETCLWSASQLETFCANNMGVFYSTKVIMPESYHFDHSISDATLNDTTAASHVDIIGGHIYGGGLASYPLATSKGKEVWMTEHLDNDTSLSAVIGTAKEISDCMNIAGFSAYNWWYLKRDYGPVDENGNRTKRGCVMAQFARVIRPGAQRVACTYNPNSNTYVTAYNNGGKAVVVAVNTGTSSVSQSFQFSNWPTVASMHIWRTSGSEDLTTLTDISLAGNAFTMTLPAQSITTFYQP